MLTKARTMVALPSVALLLAAGPSPTAEAAQSTQAAPSAEARQAEAYHEFLLGSFLEAEDNAEGAASAFRRALELDPRASGVAAELAELYVRADRPDEAKDAATQALSIDPDNASAHQTLGFLYAGLVDRADRAAGGRSATGQDENVVQAVDHLEQAVEHAAGESDASVRATLARLYVRTKDYDKAIPLLTRLVSQERGWRTGSDLLLQAYLGAGRVDDATAWLEGHAPDDPSLYAPLGNLYERAHRWTDAAGAYSEAIKVAPRSVELRTRYASSLMSVGSREAIGQARDALTDALDVGPGDVRVLYLLSQAERRLGNLAAAETWARKIITEDEDEPWGYFALSQALEPQGRYAEIVDALAPAAARLRGGGDASARDMAMLLPPLGFAYLKRGQYERAIDVFEQARALTPLDQSLVVYLVQANIAARRYTQATALAAEARADRPNDVRLARLEAEALIKGGKAKQGFQVLEDLVERRADNPTAYVALAEAYGEARRRSDAVRVLRDARGRFPEDTSIPFRLGAVLEEDKRFDEAEAAFRDAIAMDPEFAPALNYLGYMLAERGERLDESVAYLKRALAIDPDNGAYLDSIGWAYFKGDNLSLAEENLSRAAAQLEDNSVIQDHYGDVLARLSRYDEAIRAWTRALQGDGESIDRGDIEKKIRSARSKIGNR
jgi:tetratricopeptide (TPR) repeat protein